MSSMIFKGRRAMQITRAGVIPVKVWDCIYCTYQEQSDEEPEHTCTEYN